MTDLHNIDKLDRAILRRLQENGRQTYDVIGEQVGLSPSAVLRRVKRLEDVGIIERYVALIAPAKVGLGLRVLTVDDLGFAHRGGSLFMTYLQTKERLAAALPAGALSALGLGGL